VTDHAEQARYHLDRAETRMVPGQPVGPLQFHLVRAQVHLLRAQLDVLGPQPDHRAEVDKVNAVLRQRGFDWPQGAEGVDSALSSVTARLDAVNARVKEALAVCDELGARTDEMSVAHVAAGFRVVLTEDPS